MSTIFARATAAGKAGVAIIRISGPKAKVASTKLAGPLPDSGRCLRKLKSSQGDVLDEALILTFPEGASFTGEESVELHLHGSSAIVDAVTREISNIEGLRPANAGEFTWRAFENGNLDLAQIEGLADLIDAETEAQRIQAMRVFGGELGKKASTWREKILRAAALLEATIDFVDEEVPIDVNPEVFQLLSGVSDDLAKEISSSKVSERIREGFEIVILGAPNVGKSSLLNSLAGRDAAITSEIAGTTRDVIEVRMDLNGIPVTFLDTAGIREAQDEIETIGIERGLARAEAADLRILLVLPHDAPSDLIERCDLVVTSKSDIFGSDDRPSISSATGSGISELTSKITHILKSRAQNSGLAIRERHRIAMASGLSSISNVQSQLQQEGYPVDLIAEELRYATRSIDSIIGKVDVEDLLGEIFSSFCIGK